METIDAQGTRGRKASTPRTIAPVRRSEESVRANTGRTWDQWFKLLDRWGAKDKKHPQIARWLSEDQGVDGWWAQSITVAYEQERGMRAPGQRPDGTYSVTASKTVNAGMSDLFSAFTDDEVRARWLGDFEFGIRSVRAKKAITADCEGATTRVSVWFDSKGRGKSQVGVAHEKIADPRHADELKAFWRERLGVLKELLETSGS